MDKNELPENHVERQIMVLQIYLIDLRVQCIHSGIIQHKRADLKLFLDELPENIGVRKSHGEANIHLSK